MHERGRRCHTRASPAPPFVGAPRSTVVFPALVCKVRRTGDRLVIERDLGPVYDLLAVLVGVLGLVAVAAMLWSLRREDGVPWTVARGFESGLAVLVAVLVAVGAALAVRALLRTQRVEFATVELATGWLSAGVGAPVPTAMVVVELVESTTPIRVNRRRVSGWAHQLRLPDRTVSIMSTVAQAFRPPRPTLVLCAQRLAQHAFAPPWLLRIGAPPCPLS